MHLDFIRPSGQWTNEIVPCSADYQRLDVYQSKSVNGDLGGTWAPTSPIVIGGAGLFLSSSASFASGAVSTQTGGRLFTSGDWPSANTRTRSVFVPAVDCGVWVDLSAIGGGSRRQEYYLTEVRTATSVGVQVLNTTSWALCAIPTRYLHVGARIATIAAQVVAFQRPSSVPPNPPVIAPFNYQGLGYGPMHPNYEAGGGSTEIGIWLPSTAFSVGSVINPSVANNSGYYFVATSIAGGGFSGSTEPSWPTTIGSTVVDDPGGNQITWTCMGRNGCMPYKGVSPDTFFAGGSVQTLYFDLYGSGGSNIVSNATHYVVQFYMGGAANAPMMLIGFQLFYDTINTLQAPI